MPLRLRSPFSVAQPVTMSGGVPVGTSIADVESRARLPRKRNQIKNKEYKSTLGFRFERSWESGVNGSKLMNLWR